jgi:hypothetical protein
MTDAFDAYAVIYAAVREHPLGRRVLALFRAAGTQPAGTGSVLLLPEILSKPLRDGGTAEVRILAGPAVPPRSASGRPGHGRARHRPGQQVRPAGGGRSASRDGDRRQRRPVHHE